MSYQASSTRRFYTEKPVIHSRESSASSRSSASTSDIRYNSSSSSMANGYNGANHSKGSVEYPAERVHRVPEGNYRITSKVSRSGRVQVINHELARTTSDEPRASRATYEDYKETSRYHSNKNRTHT